MLADWLLIAAVFAVSAISFTGALFLLLRRHVFAALVTYTLALSSGVLLGTTFFDLIPESYDAIGETAYIFVIAGMVSFFVLEKFIHWHNHVEKDEHEEKPLAYLSLIGDGIHNFLDGAIIGVSFLSGIPLGITTTLAVIAHEIPHELGDFSILIYSGFSRNRALLFNFISALTAVIGTLVVFVFAPILSAATPLLVGFAAGNFLYIAASDIIPELHHKRKLTTSVLQTVCIIVGVVVVWLLTRYIGE